ncbi:transcriptional repressor NrdR [bacterium]|nr:transcriptional repressor NrdR [bacterium]
MICPFCNHSETKVITTREVVKFNEVKRRRECEKCLKRFTTYERVEKSLPLIVKKDGRREQFSRDKIVVSLQKAFGKKRASFDDIDEICKNIELTLEQIEKIEISTKEIGELIMEQLKRYDKIAYIRFASEYRAFKDLKEFLKEIELLQE